MKNMHSTLLKVASMALSVCLVTPVWAKPEKPEKPGPASAASSVQTPVTGVVLTVNGTAITDKDVDKLLRTQQGQSKAPVAQLRAQITTELVVRQVLLDEAKRQKMDVDVNFIEKVEDLRQRLLMEQVVADYLSNNPITDVEEKAEYDRQKKVLGGADTTPQYQLRQIVVKTEQEGRELIARAQKGEAFAKLAEVSIDESGKANGGMVGWVFPSDLFPTLSAVVVNLQKGAVSAAPIQSNAGWHVVKLEDTRPFKIPSFDESRAQIKQALLSQRRQALIDGLMKKAVIKRP
jgi:peptidyl-prolyl cis-trans isomerase C